ncbi:class I lanthipeptide [Chitinophaga sp. HK235]|uniref:class I lanthipeptide n=1 Tax=Chitinophaga sp. HK235 TaxID=2952571 RepID=UPI001BA87C04|nr:class I lanthipeptide [Chitinophaga sp. HK235]
MKKKKVSIERKLSFNKQTVAQLNDRQQQLIAGGLELTRLTDCPTGQQRTCPTIPPAGMMCVRCM